MKKSYTLNRRQVLKAGLAGAAGLMLPWRFKLPSALAQTLMEGLSDPALQPKFAYDAPNALAPTFKYYPTGIRRGLPKYKIGIQEFDHYAGLIDPVSKQALRTRAWGYGDRRNPPTWPGRTFEVRSGRPITVKWENKLFKPRSNQPLDHLLPVDTSFHWAYSLHGYNQYSLAENGVPIVTHLHGGHSRSGSDGNPEYFFSPDFQIRGPRWESKWYRYDNDQSAGNLWYHDHALGITRLNVYAGLAGFYFVRDREDTGNWFNPLGLPAYPYELAYAIQDRMFENDGSLFYPSYPGEPFYEDFITGEGAILPPDIFPGGGPTGLAEFFGDHMVVNGIIWPKADVEPRHYRMHLLNGCDSRFLGVRFRHVPMGATDLSDASAPLPFWAIGSDQGLAAQATETDLVLINPGERYDLVFDFSQVPMGSRIIMENYGADAPFGGFEFDPDDYFPDRQTDRIMAFDVVKRKRRWLPDRFDPSAINHYDGVHGQVDRVRKVALFEGKDEFGRLQPILGTAEPELNAAGQLVSGALPWHEPTTENPALNSTEIWEIYNATEDAHPVHLHLVNFEILDRQDFIADVVEQPVTQHDGAIGIGFRLESIHKTGDAVAASGVEKAPKDMVTAYPDQVTRIKATFDRPGRYVWHCHILSHEDHEMMRVLHVGPGA